MANSGRIAERALDGVTIDQPTPATQPGDVFPAGVVMAYAGSAAPTNWLICDGSVVSRATYPNLFAAIGTIYGAGDGSTTFGIPDLRGKSVVGKHSSGTFTSLGGTGGEENHTLSTAEMPVHAHSGSADTQGDHNHFSGNTGGWFFLLNNNTGSVFGFAGSGTPAIYQAGNMVTSVAGAHSHNISIGNAGSGGSHNNMHPYMVLNHIIKAS